jgi:transposase
VAKKENTVVFGAIDIDGRQIFRQYDWFDGKTFLHFLKKVHKKYRKLILFLDMASQHYKTKEVRKYMRKNRKTLRVRWIPVGCPEFDMMEECWREGENDLSVQPKFPTTKEELKKFLAKYYRTKRFSNLRMDKFLLTNRCL